MTSRHIATILMPVGPCGEAVFDTADSIEHYCSEPHDLVFVDDHTDDGTSIRLSKQKRDNWHIIRCSRRNGYYRLVHTICLGLNYIHNNLPGRCVLKLDTDALMTGPGVLTDALNFMDANPSVGLFGVYETDYNRPRSFAVHAGQIQKETALLRRFAGLIPSWLSMLHLAEKNGYRRGENVFGGAYFMTRQCLAAIKRIGALDPPYRWHSRLAEDVYFSMAAKAAGFELGHFAAPAGPLCLEYRGLPWPAPTLLQKRYKLVHSVDKGPNTTAAENLGRTARRFFKEVRENERKYHRTRQCATHKT